MIRISVLMENTPYRPGFAAEHGLSLYIETASHRLLFDAGPGAAFADNAAALGVDLGAVDLAVLSHGHDDHSGGFLRFLELNGHAPVYVSRHAFGDYYGSKDEYIGLAPELKGHPRLVPVDDALELDGELSLCSCNERERKYPTDHAGLHELRDGVFAPDDFLHEQYLLIRDGGRRIAVSGCSHKGVLNLMEWLRPDVLVGGFHFMNQPAPPEGNPALDRAAAALAGYGAAYYTCHCTGTAQYAYLRERMPLRYIAAGQVLEI